MVMRTALALLVLCAASSHAFLPKPLAVSRRSSRGLMKMSTSVENELTDPSSKEAMAVAEFRMITEDEANIRKAGGVAIGVATAAQFALGLSSYSLLSAGAFGAISVFRTGAEYQ
mmetsp:Transcript_2174/g.4825  ORF Transcript_2174/g.4825 Transcript_2174/m.4825 type:complete len:115 (-) Transcript_2174:607-951(-)